jgi:hypothetical protein
MRSNLPLPASKLDKVDGQAVGGGVDASGHQETGPWCP